ncbi:BREX-1 system adenine-specific DNA-methyltransferase PglX, partial [Candidatus Eisenbacteria bacterium]
MNTTQLKTYAPEARKAFIAAVSAQAARLGTTVKGLTDAQVQGDVLLIGGQAFPRALAEPRKKLVERVRTNGFNITIEAIAYTWFNRLVAIRYMELHGYLVHGYRVLSHPEGLGRPEILDHATDVDLPGMDKEEVVELKLDGTQDEALYRLLLMAQCNALHQAMPFLFEKIGDETELLLPANLLHTDSLIRQLVEQVDEVLWQEIEIIGWLYQFYISEKKDEVIGKVVTSEDIPAATQLFTPNWIVKYMVQNSLGAQWLATYPQSPLKAQMEYYIEPAEQTDEVKAQLVAITPRTLNPEELTLIDPASGSGHILVEAYELFKAIYLERGYRQRDVPQLILEKNLFGLDIDERAAQLTGFALMMKGRADDRRLFERGVKLNVMALVDSAGFDAEGLAKGVELSDYGLKPGDLTELRRLFERATTFGSLIQVPEELAKKLPALKQLSEATSPDLFESEALKRLGPLVRQAELLATQYDAVVANPPYMGSGGMNGLVKKFAKDHFPDAKSDLFACFIERGYSLARDAGHNAMVTMQSWMFLSSFERLRHRMLREKTITTMAHIGYNSFPSLNSKVALATAFSTRNCRTKCYEGAFINLNAAPQSADKRAVFLSRDPADRFDVAAEGFERVPGSPVAYWVAKRMLEAFGELPRLGSVAETRKGMVTARNDVYLRQWYEVSGSDLGAQDCGSG